MMTEIQTLRQAEELTFSTSDATRLFYRYWPAADKRLNGAIVLLHRGHEHSGRLQHIVDEMDLPGFSYFAWDARGHGRSERGSDPNPSIGRMVEDLNDFVQYISSRYGIPVENISVIAQSVGAVLAAAWAHDYAPKINCMVLTSPAFKVKLYIPFARLGLRMLYAIRGNFKVNSYVKAKYLTHDPERIASYEADPLITRPISAKQLLGLYSTGERVVADAQAIQVPTQLLISGNDWVVHQKPQLQFFDRLGTNVKEKHVFPGFYHDTLGEKGRFQAIVKARAFILKNFEDQPLRKSLLQADKKGYTKDEFESLRKPLSPLSPKAVSFAISRLGMRTGGRLSEGIRVGLETGFDSGSTLDYVYRNKPSGNLLIGKLIDWFYLNSAGWAGIRIRKQNLEKMLQKAVSLLRENGQPVRVVDIAAGHGRYVLDALESLRNKPDNVLLRDYSEINVRQGGLLIQKKGMQEFASFERGDAFDRDSLAQLKPRPTLGVVSGLYELFPDNQPIRDSLAGLSEAIELEGYLVYTGQPWHPQLEMIARVLSSHRDHKPWIMRRRTQAEMDELVAEAGFRKLEQLTDDEGIFTVSIAQRLRA